MPESGRSDDSLEINVGSRSLLSSLEGKLKINSQSLPQRHCIFKTPSILFRHKENAFLPNYFSIGPMHCHQENLVASKIIKLMYLNELLSRVATGHWQEAESDQEAKEIKQRVILSELIDAVKLMEKIFSACYAEHDFAVELGDEFVEVMVLDGCFIIELFRKYAEDVPRKIDDPIFSMPCMLQFLIHDLILLENQIPWLVLHTLFEKTKGPSDTKPLIQLAHDFFARSFSYHDYFKRKLPSDLVINHILDLLWFSLVPQSVDIESEMEEDLLHRWQPISSLSRLQEAGVNFKEVAAADSVMDVRFENGTLEIPAFRIREATETMLRNLIAYEQCLPKFTAIFTSYAMLLDNLIDTPSDLNILRKTGICDYWLNPEDATQYFNKLCNDVYIREFYYLELCKDLNRYCKCWWRRLRAYLVRNYFSKPWAVAAIYAFMILALTFWQTFVKEG